MSDVGRKLQAALGQVRANWSDERTRRVERSLRRRRRSRARLRIGAAVAATMALMLVGAAALLRPEHRGASARDRADGRSEKPDAELHFADGSTVSPLASDSLIRAASSSPQRTVVEIARGGARFVVSKNPQRVFRVEAGDVAVEVLGTRFSVYREAERARVDVEEGRVLVRWAGGSSELRSGESGLFPPERLPPARATNGSLEVPRRAQRSVGAPAPTWRDLAQEGDFDKAYEALARRGAPPVRDEPAELLLAADVARLSHHSGEAVGPLERLLTDHAADPRAPLAAFTLGRVLLEELGQPLQAARAFARAERLAPDGPLAQDALAREVEAWSRAGDAFAARTRAEEYVKRYPDGRRLRAVRRFGGLE